MRDWHNASDLPDLLRCAVGEYAACGTYRERLSINKACWFVPRDESTRPIRAVEESMCQIRFVRGSAMESRCLKYEFSAPVTTTYVYTYGGSEGATSVKVEQARLSRESAEILLSGDPANVVSRLLDDDIESVFEPGTEFSLAHVETVLGADCQAISVTPPSGAAPWTIWIDLEHAKLRKVMWKWTWEPEARSPESDALTGGLAERTDVMFHQDIEFDDQRFDERRIRTF